MTNQEILKDAFNKAFNNECEGACADYEGGAHRGECKVVHVKGWTYFSYCDEAIEEDRRRNLEVEVMNVMEVLK